MRRLGWLGQGDETTDTTGIVFANQWDQPTTPALDFAAGTVGGKIPPAGAYEAATGGVPASSGFWDTAKQAAAYSFQAPSGEESEYAQAQAAGSPLTSAQQQMAKSYGISTPASAMAQQQAQVQSQAQMIAAASGAAANLTKAFVPLFQPNLLQPLPVGGQAALNAQQQQSLNPALYAQQQAAAAKQKQAPKSNINTYMIVGAVVIGIGVLYFMFKDKK